MAPLTNKYILRLVCSLFLKQKQSVAACFLARNIAVNSFWFGRYLGRGVKFLGDFALGEVELKRLNAMSHCWFI